MAAVQVSSVVLQYLYDFFPHLLWLSEVKVVSQRWQISHAFWPATGLVDSSE